MAPGAVSGFSMGWFLRWVIYLELGPPFTYLKRGQTYHGLDAEKIVTCSKIWMIDQAVRLFTTGLAETRLHVPDIFSDLAKAFGYGNRFNLLRKNFTTGVL